MADPGATDSPLPRLLLWARPGDGRGDGRGNHPEPADVAERVAALGLEADVAGFDAPPGAGSRTGGVEAAIESIRSSHPDRDLLVLRADLALPDHFPALVRSFAGLEDRPARLLFPGDHLPAFDPLRGLDTGEADRASLVAWACDRVWQAVEGGSFDGSSSERVPADALWLRAGADRHGPAALLDDGYLVANRPSEAAPDEDAGPEPPHGHLAERVRGLLAEGVCELPCPDERPVTLHIAHSWGGGVWRWIEDFIDGSEAPQLVLVAVSDGAGTVCGRRLQLCALGPRRGVIRELALAPQIGSSVADHAGYRAALETVIRRYGVGRVVVSSLVGHSLDALTTGRPTLQVLHDFYPAWPLLGHDPRPFLDANDGDPDAARAAAVEAHRSTMRLQPPDPAFWNALDRNWLEAVQAGRVRCVAPTAHVARRWQALHPDAELEIDVVPHGFRPFSSEPPAIDAPALEAGSDEPLRLVIPGRLTEGKGLDLLEAALPRLAGRVRLTALGCGRDGYRLFGRSGIDVIPGYRRDELPELITALRPHAALLLSTVPETWNYTLSEIRALGLPVAATRVGSFAERIVDGRDGVLFEPDADALVDCIEQLLEAPQRLASMAAKVPPQDDLATMVAAYDARCPAGPAEVSTFEAASAAHADYGRVAAALARTRQRADRAEARRDALEQDLDKRTRWAETMERQFRERSRWAEELEATRKEQQATIGRMDREHRRALSDVQRQRDTLAGELDHLKAERERILGSRSWRITRPLRVASRLFGGGRLKLLANPLNWPALIGRFAHHVRLRGLKQTLIMMQSPTPQEPAPEPMGATAVPTADRVAAPVRFDESGSPRVSVVIPVYNQLHFTAACLHSVVRASNETSFEVIVVDDASSDDTPKWLAKCRGIRAIRNERNLGFIGTCNRGAAVARGDYLVFLNNDTEVRDGWLDALLDVFRTRTDAGVVGGKLVYADGTLQEAGGIVFDDGSGWNYGRGDEPGRPQYEFVAECDYVSGACLAIARDRFEGLGGFDTHYAPAYYEDTDLCFKVREQGTKVYVQPVATIVHFEGATSGTDVDAETGTKRFQKINREKFLERWKARLADQPPNAPDFDRADPVGALRHHRHAHRALVVDATTPMPDHDSGSVRMFALLKLLDELGYRTSFMPENRSWAGRHSQALQQAGIEVLSAPWVADIEDWLREHGRDLDLVLVSRHYVLDPLVRLIREYCPKAKLVFDTVDLHFLREQREAELAGTAAARRAAARTEQREMDLIHEADATLVVSAFERDLLAERVPDAEVHVVSNIHSLQDPGRPFDERADLLFVGGFQHPPNLDAAEWLVDDILPRVRRELPDVELHLIGSKMPESLAERRAPGLRCHGFVADLDPFLAGCRISVAPLRYGAGVKGKVNQAMSHGLPVVATSCAAEGMFTTHEHDILMADDAEAFAAEIVRLYRDEALWTKIAANGRENVRRHFSVDAARRALERLLA